MENRYKACNHYNETRYNGYTPYHDNDWIPSLQTNIGSRSNWCVFIARSDFWGGSKEREMAFCAGSVACNDESPESELLPAAHATVEALVERFGWRGTEPFELFTLEFGQNSCKIQGIFARKF